MPQVMTKKRTPGVVFQPRAHHGMLAGVEKMVTAIRPTLGPLHGVVVIEKESKVGRPEQLDDGATIARRIIQLPNRDEDVGAMYLRQVLVDLQTAVGDGSATAALLFHAVYKGGLAYIASGGNAMRLRLHLEHGANLVLNELGKMSASIEGKAALTNLAQTICYDPELARMLGEIFDIVGEFGRLDVNLGKGRILEREYTEGMYWNGSLLSRLMIPDPRAIRVQLENTALLITDLEISEPEVMLHILETAISLNIKSLMLVSRSINEQALSMLLLKQNQEKVHTLAVKTPGPTIDHQREGLEDLAVLAGGKVFLQAAGDTLKQIRASDFGYARRAWATEQYFGISGGKGDPRQLRRHISSLRIAYTDCGETQIRKRLQERIGKLMGGSSVLWVGDVSPSAAQRRKELAERTAEAMRGAMHHGVVPGGEVALLDCKNLLLEKYHQAQDTDERAAYRILAGAVEAPFQALLQNAGEDYHAILSQMELTGEGFGYDICKREVVHMVNAGIVDSSEVIRQAAYRAIVGAALALTVDVLVHRAKPPSVIPTR